ncbi:hypothetical protein ABEF95_015498 [Exophiala dermatitidis]
MTDPTDRTRWPNISTRLQNLRNLLSSERHLGADQQRAFEAIDREMDQMEADRSAARERRRRGDSETHAQDQDTQSASEGPSQSSTPANLGRTRRRALRPSERLQRDQRERLGQTGRPTTSELFVAPSDLSSAASARPDRGERLRAKRRKLANGSYEEEPRTFSYGHKGQVVPGQLRLDIVSCDGGEYSDPHIPINSYPQNVLLDDTSVYCTKSNRCNLLLKHVGGMPFTLTQIVVKAPRAGYDAPIQEGMIFVAMEDDNLLESTSQYEVHWSPKSHRRHRARPRSLPPSQEYLHSTRSPHRSIDRSRLLSNPEHLEDEDGLEISLVPGFNVSVEDPSDGEANERESPPSPRPWHDDDDSLRPYVDRYRPMYPEGERNDLWSSSSESEGYEPDTMRPEAEDRVQRQALLDMENTMAHRNRMLDLLRAQQIRDNDEVFGYQVHQAESDEEDGTFNRRSTPSRIGLRTFAPAVGGAHQAGRSDEHANTLMDLSGTTSKQQAVEAGASSSVRPAVTTPHARFFISQSKSSTAIKFDPPVSGRYILVKLWAQLSNANIDIQSILAYGYGGPRFFPSTELR